MSRWSSKVTAVGAFAIYLWSSSVVVQACAITAGNGDAGGAGGASGVLGGNAGPSGPAAGGGPGGAGGNGGFSDNGGGGGGGAGGPSVGILRASSSSAQRRLPCTRLRALRRDATTALGSRPGDGGASPPPQQIW